MRFRKVVLTLSLIQLGSASFLEELGLGSVHRQLGLEKRAQANVTCQTTYLTNIWNNCAQILQQFNLTLNAFMSINPSIGANCTNFVPGKQYCTSIAQGSPIPVSNNGQCGVQQNWNSTCIGSQWGNCCGIGGYCGTGSDFCGPGNCQEGSCYGAPTVYSTDGTCGSQHEYVICPAKYGLCCSTYGYCGNTTDFCGSGCQSGPCLSSPTSTSSATPTPTPSAGSVSTDGTCGYQGGLICNGSKFGNCCSAAGYCGSDTYSCQDVLGCQPKYGTCTVTGYAKH